MGHLSVGGTSYFSCFEGKQLGFPDVTGLVVVVIDDRRTVFSVREKAQHASYVSAIIRPAGTEVR